jgi:hypothetical protein
MEVGIVLLKVFLLRKIIYKCNLLLSLQRERGVGLYMYCITLYYLRIEADDLFVVSPLSLK